MASFFDRRQAVPIVQDFRAVSEVIQRQQNVIDPQRGVVLMHRTSVVDTEAERQVCNGLTGAPSRLSAQR